MKKTIIASQEMENLGLQQMIVTLDTDECTINRKTYYNGKISRRETEYFDNDYNILDISWDNELQYFKEKEYIIITI